MNKAELLKPANDKGLKQDERHFLGNPALMQLQLGTNYDNGSARVIDAFPQKVLAKTALLALEHVTE